MQPVNLTVDSQALYTQADGVDRAAEDINSRLAGVTAQIQALQDNWKGASSDKFQQMWQEWNTSANQLMEAMTGVGGFLRQAAAAYEETEGQIAAGAGR